ncbi:uncharacterized protein V1518DRAFT_429977 [Limtongia smithiae]|uniref:uncharacterized protein n=1 Tax=Limtongia smithiae TaxID=1125753 RepID=UPI0034CFC14F
MSNTCDYSPVPGAPLPVPLCADTLPSPQNCTRLLRWFSNSAPSPSRPPSSTHPTSSAIPYSSHIKPVDWETCKSPAAKGTHVRVAKQAIALPEIYDNPAIAEENAAWFSVHRPDALPLVAAVVRINAACHALANGHDEVTSDEFAEVQTMRRINAVAMTVLNEICRDAKGTPELRRLTHEIHDAKEIIQAQEHTIKSKMSASKYYIKTEHE